MEMSTQREQEEENPLTQERRTYNTGKEKTRCRAKGKHSVQNNREISYRRYTETINAHRDRDRCYPPPNNGYAVSPQKFTRA